jgi:hypothetical protein
MTDTSLPPTNGSQKLEERASRWANLPIHFLVISTEQYIVFLDEAYDVDWQTTDEYDRAHEADWTERGSVLNRVAFLQAVPVGHLEDSQRLGFRRMLGEAVARAFDGNLEAAESMLEKAEEFVALRNREHARLWYLSASAITAGLFVIVALLAWVTRELIAARLGVWFPDVVVAVGAGAIGALLSTYRRLGNLPLDPSAGRKLHSFEGAGHVVLGSVGGGIVWLAAASGVIAPQLLSAPHGQTLWLLLCVVGGSSERLVPSLVDRFELAMTRTPGAPPKPDRKRSSR